MRFLKFICCKCHWKCRVLYQVQISTLCSANRANPGEVPLYFYRNSDKKGTKKGDDGYPAHLKNDVMYSTDLLINLYPQFLAEEVPMNSPRIILLRKLYPHRSRIDFRDSIIPAEVFEKSSDENKIIDLMPEQLRFSSFAPRTLRREYVISETSDGFDHFNKFMKPLVRRENAAIEKAKKEAATLQKKRTAEGKKASNGNRKKRAKKDGKKDDDFIPNEDDDDDVDDDDDDDYGDDDGDDDDDKSSADGQYSRRYRGGAKTGRKKQLPKKRGEAKFFASIQGLVNDPEVAPDDFAYAMKELRSRGCIKSVTYDKKLVNEYYRGLEVVDKEPFKSFDLAAHMDSEKDEWNELVQKCRTRDRSDVSVVIWS